MIVCKVFAFVFSKAILSVMNSPKLRDVVEMIAYSPNFFSR